MRRASIPGASLCVALAVTACLLWTGIEAPLPALGWAAAFLLLAVEQDVRRLRIPNWLTFPSLVAALGYGAWLGGWSGFGMALCGAAAAFGVLFVPFAMRWLGAGDVKALMVLGALWGAKTVLPMLWWMLVVGGVLALAFLIFRGGLRDLLSRWLHSAKITFLTRKWTYYGPVADSTAAAGVPFAVAMGLGAAAHQIWGMPWF
jgi:prepilin peptidase CpaA